MRIGIDLGGTKIEAVVLNDTGGIAFRERRATPRGDYDGTIEAIAGLVDEAERSVGARCSVGIGMPGAISPATGVVKNANSTWLNGRRLHEDLQARLARPVRLANDANCFALSEASDGAGAGAETVFGVILGTGCGGGVVVRGGVLTGPNAVAGEWGHNPLPWPRDDERPGPPCYCGKHGCLETFVSGTGLALDYERHTGTRVPAVRSRLARDRWRRGRASRARPLRGSPRARPRDGRQPARSRRHRAGRRHVERHDAVFGGASPSAWLRLLRSRRHAHRPAEARRFERRPRRRLVVAGRSPVAHAFRPADRL